MGGGNPRNVPRRADIHGAGAAPPAGIAPRPRGSGAGMSNRGRIVSGQSPAAEDAALVERARRGDASAFGELYLRHAPGVHRFVYRLTADPGASEDLTQDVFVAAWGRLGRYAGGCRLSTWLFGIAVGLVANHRRRSRREVPGGARRESACPRAVAERGERVGRVRAAIAALPEGQQAVIALRDLEGLSCGEVAAALGCGEACVRVRLFRARRALRDRLVALGFGGADDD